MQIKICIPHGGCERSRYAEYLHHYTFVIPFCMALNIKNPEVERLVDEVVAVTGETKTEAIRQALAERQARLRMRVSAEGRRSRVESFLEREIWSRVPEDQRGHAPTKEEREAILGYGEEGV